MKRVGCRSSWSRCFLSMAVSSQQLLTQCVQGCASEEDIIAHIIKMNEEQFPGQEIYIIDDIMTVFLASVSTIA